MTTLTLKNVPDVIHAQLKQRAAQNKRSLNQEAILCLGQSLGAAVPSPEALLALADQLRATVTTMPCPESDWMDWAIRFGRE